MLRCLSTELCLADAVASGIAGLLALNFAQPPVERTTLREAQVREITPAIMPRWALSSRHSRCRLQRDGPVLPTVRGGRSA